MNQQVEGKSPLRKKLTAPPAEIKELRPGMSAPPGPLLTRARLAEKRRVKVLPALASIALLMFPHLTPSRDEWAMVGRVLGKEGEVCADGIYRVTFSRNDLPLAIDGVRLHGSFLRGTWISFERLVNTTRVMAGLALAEDEIKPVMERLELGGFQIAGLHNSLLRLQPPVMFLHAVADGDAAALARTLHETLLLTATPFSLEPEALLPADVDHPEVDRVIGAPGRVRDGVLQYRMGRRDVISERGLPVRQTMGVEFSIQIQPLGAGKAVVNGELPLVEPEIQPVLNELRADGFEVTALHHHMTTEYPRLFFLHFYADDGLMNLAYGIRAALQKTNAKINPL